MFKEWINGACEISRVYIKDKWLLHKMGISWQQPDSCTQKSFNHVQVEDLVANRSEVGRDEREGACSTGRVYRWTLSDLGHAPLLRTGPEIPLSASAWSCILLNWYSFPPLRCSHQDNNKPLRKENVLTFIDYNKKDDGLGPCKLTWVTAPRLGHKSPSGNWNHMKHSVENLLNHLSLKGF